MNGVVSDEQSGSNEIRLNKSKRKEKPILKRQKREKKPGRHWDGLNFSFKVHIQNNTKDLRSITWNWRMTTFS